MFQSPKGDYFNILQDIIWHYPLVVRNTKCFNTRKHIFLVKNQKSSSLASTAPLIHYIQCNKQGFDNSMPILFTEIGPTWPIPVLFVD